MGCKKLQFQNCFFFVSSCLCGTKSQTVAIGSATPNKFLYRYDKIGNRTKSKSSSPSVLLSYTSNNLNQYTKIKSSEPSGISEPTYDVFGQMTQCSLSVPLETAWSYSWNFHNRLVAAKSADTRLTFTYDPNGRRVTKKVYKKSGTETDNNPFRFSAEYANQETGRVYYNYRYYSPELGRWLSRDGIGERGGINLFAMVSNNAINWWDYLGLTSMREIKNKEGNVVATVDTQRINCIGYAFRQDGDLQPIYNRETKKGTSLKQVVNALGYKCTSGISAKDCYCHCECKEYVMLYVYILEDKDKDKIKRTREAFKKAYPKNDVYNRPVMSPKNAVNIDFQGLRGEADGSYTYQGLRTGKRKKKIRKYKPTSKNPDFYPSGRTLGKYCCCKE